MQKIGKKFYIVLLSIFVLSFGFLTIFYYKYQQSLLTSNYEKVLLNHSKSSKDYLINKIDSRINIINSKSNIFKDKTLDEYIDILNSMKEELDFSYVLTYDDEFLYLNKVAYSFKSDLKTDNLNLRKKQFSFYRFEDLVNKNIEDNNTYLFLNLNFNEDKFLVAYDLNFFKDYLNLYKELSSYFIIEKNGKISLENRQTSSYSLYQQLEEENNISQLNEYSASLEKDSNLIKLNLFSKKNYVAFQNLGNDYYLLEGFNESFVLNNIKDSSVVALIYFSFIVVLLLLIIIVLSTIFKKFNDDVEISRLKYMYSKPYIINISNDYKIKKVSKSFKKDFPDWKENDDLNNYKLFDNNDLSACLEKEASFKLVYQEKILLLNIIRKSNGYILIGIDKTEETLDNIRAKKHAYNSEMTNLPNYLSLETDYERNYHTKPFTAILIDLLNFRNTNKLYGRHFCDELIKEIALVLTEDFVKNNGKVYQIGIDRFVLILPSITEQDKADAFSKEIINYFNSPMTIFNIRIILKIKLGVYVYTMKEEVKFVDMLANLDIALKKAKESRTFDYILYNLALGQSLTREQVLENDLALGIKNNEFKMYYQPQYNNELEKIVSFEALIRWDNPKYIHESPALYIEIAEKNNLIFEIGKIVKDNTFRFAKSMEKYGIRISINVSPSELLEVGFIQQIKDFQEKYDLKTSSIAIEITETVLMESFDEVLKKINVLKSMGFKIHLDDFGTGYSSMLYLKNLPFDTLKIDKEFTKTINTDKYSKVIVSKIISLAKSLDMDVIAEGVEDDKQNSFLYKNGCNIIQGYLVSKAVDEKLAEEMIIDYNITKKKVVKSVK